MTTAAADSASYDGAANLVRQRHPNVRLLLLNPEAVLNPDALDQLLSLTLRLVMSHEVV